MHQNARLNLSDLYAYVGEKIYNWNGFKETSEESQQSAMAGYYKTDLWTPSKLFCGASNIYNDYVKGYYSGDEYVNLILPNLREIYNDNESKLDSERTLFMECMNRDIPRFMDVSEYKRIQVDKNDISLYQLMGDITPYDVLHITLKDFVTIVESGEIFDFEIYPLNYHVYVFYDRSDFYDPETETILID